MSFGDCPNSAPAATGRATAGAAPPTTVRGRARFRRRAAPAASRPAMTAYERRAPARVRGPKREPASLKRRLTNGCAWNAVSAFANCGRAVAHVRGSYVPEGDITRARAVIKVVRTPDRSQRYARVAAAHITRWRWRPPMRAGLPQGRGRPRSYIPQRPWEASKRLDHKPQIHRESQSKPDQIAWGLVYGPNGFALGAANAGNHDRERPHKQRAKNDGQYSQPHRDGRCRRPDVRWTELSRFGAHGLNPALIAIPPFPLQLLGT